VSRSAKRFLLLFPLLIVGAFLMHRAPDASSDAPAAGDADRGVPALAAMEPAAPQRSPADARSDAAAAPQRPAPVDRPTRDTAGRTVTVRMLVTAYCPCPKCCGKYSDGITASGKSIYANDSRFVAADTSILPFGTKVSVPGYNGGRPVPVLDRGGKIKGHHLDVFFLTHQRALQWGRRWVDVTVHLD
jgi:3D (Asp-Asp-Asp) domain-containing protein